MKMTVLGNHGAYPGPDSACSGYLVCDNDAKVLLDCGSGVLSNLQKHIDIRELDALVLSHLHSDHSSDVILLGHAIGLMMERGLRTEPLDIYAPDEPREEFVRLHLKKIFNITPITPVLTLKIGGMTITFGLMNHPMINYGISVESGGRRFTYSGDTGWADTIIDFFRGADLLILDSGMMAKDKTGDIAPHMTARECGIAGRKAGAKKLLLSHFKPYHDLEILRKEAAENYPEVGLTVMHQTYLI